MGEIIQKYRVRTIPRGSGRLVTLYFDTGTEFSLMKTSVAERLGHLHELGEPKQFGGLGNGRFLTRSIAYFEVCLLEFWCAHFAYVVEDRVLGDEYDVLIGHNFMQGFNVRCDPRRHRILLNRGSLRMAQRVHNAHAL